MPTTTKRTTPDEPSEEDAIWGPDEPDPAARSVVAIDGPAGSGKSTLASRLAASLHLPYINTGLMYRALARRALDGGIDPDDAAGLLVALEGIGFELSDADPPSLLVDGAEPGEELRTPDLERIVSRVSRHPVVRAWMRDRQRDLGQEGGVMEGRDIGTVVFPEAPVKLYLSAELGVRGERRAGERGTEDAVTEVVRDVAARDHQDASTNPLEPAPGAHVLDTTVLDADQVFDAALSLIGDAQVTAIAAGPRTIRGLTPNVAIVGRQNVGKSTLLNRLYGRKLAIADEMPGVTRDRLEVPVTWEGTSFTLVDTGGFLHGARGIELSVAAQAERAAAEADLVLLVVDGSTGIQEEDATLALRILRSGVPALLVANKVDSDRLDAQTGELLALGLGPPVAVSALHGRGSGELLDRIVAGLPESPEPQPDDEARFAIVGKPNVGKSSLFNRLLEEERSVVHDEAGTTRDAIDSLMQVEGQTIRFIDTAGLRKRTKTQGVEFYGLLRTERTIQASDVALLVVDTTQGLTAEDTRIAADVMEAGRGLVVALNKWDLVDSEERDHLFKYLKRELRLFPGTPVLRMSAVRGTGVRRVIPALLAVHANRSRRVSTSEVNRALERYVAHHPPPRGTGTIRYGTQVSARPPTFVIFGIGDPGPAYTRYMENSLRRDFGFDGTPVRLSFRPKRTRGEAKRGR